MPGIIRKLDLQRRLVLPRETLRAAGFKPGDLLEIYSDVGEDGLPCLMLTLYKPGCALCGRPDSDRGYITFEEHDKMLCEDCAAAVVRALGLEFQEKAFKSKIEREEERE